MKAGRRTFGTKPNHSRAYYRETRNTDPKKRLGERVMPYFLAILKILGKLASPVLALVGRQFSVWGAWHSHVMQASLGRLFRTPLVTLMTGSVIGVALAFPAGLYVLLENAQAISQGWAYTAQISLFLTTDKTDDDAREIAVELRHNPAISRVQVITRGRALEEYQQLSGFQTLFDALEVDNPLPAVLVLYPVPEHTELAAIDRIMTQLRQRDDVEIAQFDLQWLKRLYAMIEFIQRAILGLAILLALGVLLIIGNTIRLDIRNRRDEIEITRLFGATNSFIRRPFLYVGFWYGLLGGSIAWLFVSMFFALLHGPLTQLATLYETSFPALLPGIDTLLILLCAGAVLGLSGSWIAVGRHLGKQESA